MTETARMYGGSLYDLAAEEGLETRILGELDEAVALFKASPEYLHLLSTPSIPKKERCGLLDEALRDRVHLNVLNFLKILCENGTLRELPGCARAYRIRYNQAFILFQIKNFVPTVLMRYFVFPQIVTEFQVDSAEFVGGRGVIT